MKVRVATGKDLNKLVKLLEKANYEFGKESIPFCPKTTRNMIQRVINHQNHICYVLDDEGELRGVLAGLNNQLWYSKKRQVTDLIYFVEEGTRGHGVRLLSAFLGWARAIPNLGEISMSVTSGANNVERTERLLEASGLIRVGGVFITRPNEKGEEQWVA